MAKKERVIFHIDVNSAYLSFEAVYRLQHGASVDLREIPSAVAGSQETRHGIILAKSIPAKKYGVKTGEFMRFSSFGSEASWSRTRRKLICTKRWRKKSRLYFLKKETE